MQPIEMIEFRRFGRKMPSLWYINIYSLQKSAIKEAKRETVRSTPAFIKKNYLNRRSYVPSETSPRQDTDIHMTSRQVFWAQLVS